MEWKQNSLLRPQTLLHGHASLRSVRRFLHATTALATTHGYLVPSPRDRSLDSTTKYRFNQESCGVDTLTSFEVHQLLPRRSNLLQSPSWCLHRRKNVGTPKQKSKQLYHVSRPQPEMHSFDRKYRHIPPALCMWKIKPPQRHPHQLQRVVIHSVNEERPSA